MVPLLVAYDTFFDNHVCMYACLCICMFTYVYVCICMSMDVYVVYGGIRMHMNVYVCLRR